MKIIHSSFVKGTLPRLVGLKLALQLCFALQARACLFRSWKQLGVETHKKPALCEMQKEYMIFFKVPSLFFCLFFLASPMSLWWPSFLAEDQTCLQSFLVLHLLREREPECWGPIFSHRSNMPATECKLHSLLRAWSALISSLDPCFSLAYKFIPASSNWIPSLMLRREHATGRRRRVDFMVTEELSRKVFLSSLQPFLREETNRFLRLRRAAF